MAKTEFNEGNATKSEYVWSISSAVGRMFLEGGLTKAVLKPEKLGPKLSIFCWR